MRQVTAVRQQRALPLETSRKLNASRKETVSLILREIHCPYCGFLVEKVFSDVTGHKIVYCRKCKTEYPINLGYFRRMKKMPVSHRPALQRAMKKR